MTIDRLVKTAAEVVLEYESHGGEGTHQECMPGCGCLMRQRVAALSSALLEWYVEQPR